jgi:hypothetical protein
MLVAGDRWYRDVSLSATVRVTREFGSAGQTWTGLVLRAQTPYDTGPWRNAYLVLVRARGGVELLAMGHGSLGRADIPDLDSRTTAVRLRAEAVGDRIRVWVDGSLCLDIEDSTWQGGAVGVVNFANTAEFHGLHVEGTALHPDAVLEPVVPDHPRPDTAPPVTPLPRIRIDSRRDGPSQFRHADTGQRFLPQGFNHTVLSGGSHATLDPDVYDPQEMEAILAAMRDLGANALRLWFWTGNHRPLGFCGPQTTSGLDPAYMANVLDLLRRATRHGIYVMPILDEPPANRFYDSIVSRVSAAAPCPAVSGYNRRFLSPGFISAKAQAAQDFVSYIRDADPGLLSTVLAWQLGNELFANADEGPFVLESGVVQTASGHYDMADKLSRQACWDEGIRHWCNELTKALKEVDPDGLVMAGMWTADAQARPPINGLYHRPERFPDGRVPPRPSVLTGPPSLLDALDIHIYPWGNSSQVRPPAHEWIEVVTGGKPIVCGEYGAFRNVDYNEGCRRIGHIRDQAYAMGYQGSLFWSWSLEGTYHAQEGGIAELVAPRNAAPAVYTWSPPAPLPPALMDAAAPGTGLRLALTVPGEDAPGTGSPDALTGVQSDFVFTLDHDASGSSCSLPPPGAATRVWRIGMCTVVALAPGEPLRSRQHAELDGALRELPADGHVVLLTGQPSWRGDVLNNGWYEVEALLSPHAYTVVAPGPRHSTTDRFGMRYVTVPPAGPRQETGRSAPWITVLEFRNGETAIQNYVDGVPVVTAELTPLERALSQAFTSGRRLQVAPPLPGLAPETSILMALATNPGPGFLKGRFVVNTEPATAADTDLGPLESHLMRFVLPRSAPTVTGSLEWQLDIVGTGRPPVSGCTPIPGAARLTCPLLDAEVRVDGGLDDWGRGVPVDYIAPAQLAMNADAWTGPGDAAFQLLLAHSHDDLFVAIRVLDDDIRAEPGRAPWEQDGIELRIDPRPVAESAFSSGTAEESAWTLLAVSPTAAGADLTGSRAVPEGTRVACRRDDRGYTCEVAIPLRGLTRVDPTFGVRPLRLNLAVDDADGTDSVPAQLWWYPDWRTPETRPGTGLVLVPRHPDPG